MIKVCFYLNWRSKLLDCAFTTLHGGWTIKTANAFNVSGSLFNFKLLLECGVWTLKVTLYEREMNDIENS